MHLLDLPAVALVLAKNTTLCFQAFIGVLFKNVLGLGFLSGITGLWVYLLGV